MTALKWDDLRTFRRPKAFLVPGAKNQIAIIKSFTVDCPSTVSQNLQPEGASPCLIARLALPALILLACRGKKKLISMSFIFVNEILVMKEGHTKLDQTQLQSLLYLIIKAKVSCVNQSSALYQRMCFLGFHVLFNWLPLHILK